MNYASVFKMLEKIYAHSEVCLKPAEVLIQGKMEGKVMNMRQIITFLNCSFFSKEKQ